MNKGFVTAKCYTPVLHMALPMPSPQKHPKTGVYWFRQRVPEDLRAVVGKGEITRSLGTKIWKEAKILFGPVAAEVAAQWASLRLGQQSLSHKDIQALAGAFYRETIDAHDDEPGAVETWLTRLRTDQHAIQVRRNRPGALFGRFGPEAMAFLEKRGIALDTPDLMRFVSAVSAAKVQAIEQIVSRAQGDYREHRDAGRFPAFNPPALPKAEHQFEALWTRYAKERGLKPRTARRFHSIIEEMVEIVGKTDLGTIVEEDLLGWRDKLEARPGLKAITIRDSHLAAVKAIFGWAKFKRIFPENPAENVHVSVGKSGKKMRGFSDDEAATILSACLAAPSSLITAEHAAARRWVPWLCAYTGARVNELTQLRASDVMKVDGVWLIRITVDAGTVKTGEDRNVALHSHLIDMGFLDFAGAKQADEPLFYDPGRKRPGEGARAQYETVGAKLSSWVRGLGIDDPGVAPNHGWRHRFKTLRRRHGLDKEVIDAIQGHAPATEGEHYGETEVAAMRREIEKIPRYEVEGVSSVDRRRKPAVSSAKPLKVRRSPTKGPTSSMVTESSQRARDAKERPAAKRPASREPVRERARQPAAIDTKGDDGAVPRTTSSKLRKLAVGRSDDASLP